MVVPEVQLADFAQVTNRGVHGASRISHMLRCIKRLVVDMLGPIRGLIGEDRVENPALGQEAQHVNTSTTKRQRKNRERPPFITSCHDILYGDARFAQHHREAS